MILPKNPVSARVHKPGLQLCRVPPRMEKKFFCRQKNCMDNLSHF